MAADWLRNTTWNKSVERAFDEKLRRARRKGQYPRIQARKPAHSHPEVALKLLDQYFELPNNFDHAQPHIDRAIGLLALCRVNDTIASYESALVLDAAALEHFRFRDHPSECRITTGYRGRGCAPPLNRKASQKMAAPSI